MDNKEIIAKLKKYKSKLSFYPNEIERLQEAKRKEFLSVKDFDKSYEVTDAAIKTCEKLDRIILKLSKEYKKTQRIVKDLEEEKLKNDGAFRSNSGEFIESD